ncbi:hypothetical protein K2173_010710 [Erythroxylum novogranatense]|uniref:DUF1995 domain-containing protein n=1 Tax=Erythroxylum novogranatense TaxID=1862640 RepID=A0AAV8SRV0_9ROSI|nr:hypothetical protein K2173_010710 [Erythroxylum novogranatense]
MASNLLKFNVGTWKTVNPLNRKQTLISPLLFSRDHHYCYSNNSYFSSSFSHKPLTPSLHIHSSLSSSNSNPPTTKDEAILQAKTCLAATLEKPLNSPKFAGKFKKLKQPKFQVEIPLIDDSSTSISQLAFDVFINIPTKRKGSTVKITIIWPSSKLKDEAIEVFQSHPLHNITHVDISAAKGGDARILNSAEVAVFMAPESSQLSVVKIVSDSLYPKPVVMFNPRWGFEEESEFGELSEFLRSFEVIYSFMGLEVRGVLSKRKGVVFKCVRDGVVSGEKWSVLVEEEEEDKGELKVVSRFKTRPSIGEVENVLYNLMAINSPITKSAKFLRDLISNVTGKKN